MKKLKGKLPLLLIVLLLLAGGAFAYVQLRDTSSSAADQTGTDLAEGEINYGPLTEEEKAQAEANKDKVVDRINAENQTPSGKKAVVPIITYAQQIDEEVRVNAYIPSVFEDGGTCTFTFSSNGQTVTRTTTAFSNVSTTDCERLVVSKSEFSAGNWQVKISYASPTAEGESGSTTVGIN